MIYIFFNEGVFVNILKLIFSQISPQIRKIILDFLLNLKSAASKTENDWDDIAVYFLFFIFGFDYNSK